MNGRESAMKAQEFENKYGPAAHQDWQLKAIAELRRKSSVDTDCYPTPSAALQRGRALNRGEAQ